jgi:hypothetical protein
MKGDKLKRLLVLVATTGLVYALVSLPMAVPAAATSGPKLHPSGFGEHSYSAWKAHEGLPDSRGNDDQALYFQKMTSTATFAAGVAVFKGFEGMSTAAIGPLGFYYRSDGHCGAGAPRFNLRVENSLGVRQTFFFGCNSGMVPGGTAIDDQGRVWFERTTAGPLPPGTVVSLSIVYDEGNEFPPGYVYLDNIQAGGHVWTDASDNGNGQVIMAEPTGNEIVEEFLGESLSVLFP